MRKLAVVIAVPLVIAACGPAPPSSLTSPTPTAPPARAQATASPEAKLWRAAAAPTAAPAGGEWIAIDTFDGRTVLAAVVQPAGAGPWPVAVFLHNSSGMQPRDLDFASWLAKEGFLTVVPCWARTGSVLPANLGCVVDARRLDGNETALLRDVVSISEAARTLPKARPDRLVLVGHSLGAWAAVDAASTGGQADAVVSMSGAYSAASGALSHLGAMVKQHVDGLRSPLLIVHGTKDDVWVIGPAREYEKLALERGKKVEALFVEGAPHAFPFRPEFWTDEVRGRVATFLKKQL